MSRNLEHSILVLFRSPDIALKECKVQYIVETEQLCKYPYDVDDPSNMIDNLGAPCHIYLVSNEKIKVGDVYILTEMKTVEYGVIECLSERNAEIANSNGHLQRKLLMTTDPDCIENNNIPGINTELLDILMLIKNKRSDIFLEDAINKYLYNK